MNDTFIVPFVIPPELGYLKRNSELPQCTASIDGQSIFVLQDNEGPDLRTCFFPYSQNPGKWCGKNDDDCIER